MSIGKRLRRASGGLARRVGF